ncbi:MAG: hypothetical protein U0641_05150 [Anaerolineae bacterium]
MKRRDSLTKILAVAGTVLMWLPFLAPVLLAIGVTMTRGRFLFDYLMPAELFPAVLGGGALLLAAAVRMRSRRALIGGALGIAVGALAAGQALAVVTGLASGETGPSGWPWALVLGSLAAYSLAVAAMGIGGLLLLRDLFRTPRG